MPSVDIRITPQNLLLWSNMEDWDAGASAAPTEHTLSGTSATIARESTIVKQGTYSAAVARAGNDATLYHDFIDYADYVKRKMTFGCWVYATVANRARISISDGVGATNSSYHSGAAGWEFLTVTHNIDPSATRIRVEMQVNTGNTTAYFDGGVLADGDVCQLILSSVADISKWTPTNRYKGQEFAVARRPGAKIPNMFLDSKSIKLEGTVLSSTVAGTRTNLDTLKKSLNSERYLPNGDRLPLDLSLFDDRFYRGLPHGFTEENIAALRLIKFAYEFSLSDPFAYYIQMLRSKTTISANPTTISVTVNGNALTRPIFRITNNSSNITSLQIDNLTTNQSLTYTGSLATSSTLVVDTNDLSIKKDGVSDISNLTGEFDIIMVPGINEIKITGLVSGIAKIDWFDRWY